MHTLTLLPRLVSSVAARNASSVVIDALVVTVSSKLACLSAQQSPRQQVLALPQELLDMVINYAIEESQSSQKSSSLCNLLHTSTWCRARVVRAFTVIQLYERGQPPSDSRVHEIRLPWTLIDGIWRTLKYHLLLDFSIRRKRNSVQGSLGAP